MADSLHQINVNYQPVEDRLLLRIKTLKGNEFRLWLTRRFTGLLVELLGEQIKWAGGIPAVAFCDETKNLFKQGALDKPYEQDQVKDLPLGESGILASRINYKTSAEGNFMLEILPVKGQGITLNLNKPLLFMFYNLLLQGCSQSMWRLPKTEEPCAHIH